MAHVSNVYFVNTVGPVVHLLLAPVLVAAGYPSPAQDYFDGRLNLNDHLIQDVTSTYELPRGFRTAELVDSSTLPVLAVDNHSGLR